MPATSFPAMRVQLMDFSADSRANAAGMVAHHGEKNHHTSAAVMTQDQNAFANLCADFLKSAAVAVREFGMGEE